MIMFCSFNPKLDWVVASTLFSVTTYGTFRSPAMVEAPPDIWVQLVRFLKRPTVTSMYSESTLANWRTALRAYREVVRPDEFRSARAIHEGLSALTARIAAQRRTAPSTLESYRRRMEALLESFMGLNVQSFIPAKRSLILDPATGVGAPLSDKGAVPGELAAVKPLRVGSPVATALRPMRTIVLSGRRQFTYDAPDPFSTADVVQIALHLATSVGDFDPAVATELLKLLRPPDAVGQSSEPRSASGGKDGPTVDP